LLGYFFVDVGDGLALGLAADERDLVVLGERRHVTHLLGDPRRPGLVGRLALLPGDQHR